MRLHVAGLWRYPVKSMAGEALPSAVFTSDGIPGDRLVHVRGPEGLRTARRYHRLLGLKGTLSTDGRALINGLPWDSAEALALVKAAAGDDAWLAAYDGPERFDILPLLVATDGAVAAFGRDIRRLRPNILIAGVDGMDERSWPGAAIHIGASGTAADVVVRIDALRGRCAMTIVDPDTLVRDHEVLRDIGRRFGGKLALDADVTRPGTVHVGDEARVVHEAGTGVNAIGRAAATDAESWDASIVKPVPAYRTRRLSSSGQFWTMTMGKSSLFSTIRKRPSRATSSR